MSRRPRPGDVCVPASFATALAGPLAAFVRSGRLQGERAIEFVRDLEAVARLARSGGDVFGLDSCVLLLDSALAAEVAPDVVTALNGLMRAGVELPAAVVTVARDLATVQPHTCNLADQPDQFMLTVKVVAERYGLHRNTVLDAIRRSALPAERTSAGFRMSGTDVTEWRASIEEARPA